jgi:hypothetical protein
VDRVTALREIEQLHAYSQHDQDPYRRPLERDLAG